MKLKISDMSILGAGLIATSVYSAVLQNKISDSDDTKLGKIYKTIGVYCGTFATGGLLYYIISTSVDMRNLYENSIKDIYESIGD